MATFSRSIFKFLASLKLAVILLLMLASILAAATYYESVYDTKTAQHLVYNSSFFAAFLALLFTNVLCSAAIRYPWKRHQFSFVVTHLGILILLLGSFQTMVGGVEGSLALEEGRSSNRMLIDQPVFMVGPTGNNLQEIPAEFRWRAPSPEKPARVNLGNGMTAVVQTYLHHSKPHSFFVDEPGSGVAAAEIHLKNSRVDVREWITAGRGDLALGPATVMMRRLKSERDVKEFLTGTWQPRECGELQLLIDGQPRRLAVADVVGQEVAVEGTDYRVKVLQYLPHAIPVNGKLISKSDQPVNPMVELVITHPKSKASQTWLLFARLPELNTRHKSQGKELPVRLLYSFDPPAPDQHRLVIGVDEQGRLYSKVDDKPGQLIKEGQTLATGWMDIQFTLEKFVARGREIKEYLPVTIEKGMGEGPPPAIYLSLEGSRRKEPFWLERGDVIQVESQDGQTVILGYALRSMDLGFSVHLKKFHIDFDPGTRNAAAYRSEVEVDGKTHIIQMNEPLVKNGYKMFQASFGETGGPSQVSILTVARDPGIVLKYGGSIMLVAGIAMMFYLKPYQLRRRVPRDRTGEKDESGDGDNSDQGEPT